MNTLIAAAIRCLLMLLVPTAGYAISAQWDLDPISGDWNTADNWTPNGVPNGPADIATFGLSNSTIVDISEDTEVNGIIFTPAATNPYDIFIGSTLTISGVGITNNSGKTQFFEIDFGTLNFTNSATAGNNVVITAQAFYGGSTNFFDRSSAGSAGLNVRDDSILSFFDNSTAGDATISVTSSEGGGDSIILRQFYCRQRDNLRLTVQGSRYRSFCRLFHCWQRDSHP